MSLLNFK